MNKSLLLYLFLFTSLWAKKPFQLIEEKNIIAHIVDLKKDELHFYHRDEKGTFLKNFDNLSKYVGRQNKELLFAMNAGIYMENFMPLGLYVENGKIVRKTNRVQNAYGNFYMQPNGIFFITQKGNAYIKRSSKFHFKSYVKYATQSGPMLLIKGKIHPKFRKGSSNLHVRNGVGILADGRLLFAISDGLINFYDFALFFQKNGCKNALYLDGAISQIYLPPEHTTFGFSQFAVMIGEVRKK